jgi:hypothetical protein
MNKHIEEIKRLAKELNCMGTYGLIELELNELEKELKNNIPEHSKNILIKILDELEKAEAKHPDWPCDILHQIAIVNEESGEATRAALQFFYKGGGLENVQAELIQTAAMCIRMLENINTAFIRD